jgi:hypothetical protein
MKKKNLITRIATLEKELAEMKRERDMLIENTPEEALAIAEIKARYNMRKDMQHFDDRIHETIMSRRRDGDGVLIAAGLFNQIEAAIVSEKPPLGLRPKYISDSDRADEIMAAIHRYEAAGKIIPEAWYVELGKLLYKPKL